MEQIKEAVYLINDERYLHLRENGAVYSSIFFIYTNTN